MVYGLFGAILVRRTEGFCCRPRLSVVEYEIGSLLINMCTFSVSTSMVMVPFVRSFLFSQSYRYPAVYSIMVGDIIKKDRISMMAIIRLVVWEIAYGI